MPEPRLAARGNAADGFEISRVLMPRFADVPTSRGDHCALAVAPLRLAMANASAAVILGSSLLLFLFARLPRLIPRPFLLRLLLATLEISVCISAAQIRSPSGRIPVGAVVTCRVISARAT